MIHEELGFQTHTVELLEKSAIQIFYPWQKYNFPSMEKRFGIWFFRVKKVHDGTKKSSWMLKSS